MKRTFVSKECPYFEVVVEFEAVGRPNRDEQGRVTLVENSRDVIELSRGPSVMLPGTIIHLHGIANKAITVPDPDIWAFQISDVLKDIEDWKCLVW